MLPYTWTVGLRKIPGLPAGGGSRFLGSEGISGRDMKHVKKIRDFQKFALLN